MECWGGTLGRQWLSLELEGDDSSSDEEGQGANLPALLFM